MSIRYPGTGTVGWAVWAVESVHETGSDNAADDRPSTLQGVLQGDVVETHQKILLPPGSGFGHYSPLPKVDCLDSHGLWGMGLS